MRKYIISCLLLLSAVSAFAQTMPDVPEPTAYVIDAKGEEAELSPGGDFSVTTIVFMWLIILLFIIMISHKRKVNF